MQREKATSRRKASDFKPPSLLSPNRSPVITSDGDPLGAATREEVVEGPRMYVAHANVRLEC